MDANAPPPTAAPTADPLTGDLELEGAETEGVTGGGLTISYCSRCDHAITNHPRNAYGYYCVYTGYHYCN